MGSNLAADKSLVFKWRRTEGWTHCPLSFGLCTTNPREYLSYNRKYRIKSDPDPKIPKGVSIFQVFQVF